MAEKCLPTAQRMQGFNSDGDVFRNFINGKKTDGPNINSVGADVENLEKLKKQALEQAAGAARLQTYLTVAQMRADMSQPVPTTGQVTNDPNADSNGYYVWDGSNWLWSGLQPATVDALRWVDGKTDTAVDLASSPGLLGGDFYVDDREGFSSGAVDEAGNLLHVVDSEGYVVSQSRGEFYEDDSRCEAYGFVDDDGKTILAVDEDSQIIPQWMFEFFSHDEQPDYCHVDSKGVVFLGWLQSGEFVVGGGGRVDWGSMPTSSQHVETNEPWLNNGVVEVKRAYSDLYTTPVATLFPTYQSIHGYLDGLMSEYPDYITKDQLGADEWGNSIYQYTASTADLIKAGWTEEQVAPPKIVILGGVHGIEKEAVLSNVILLREICELWKQDEMLAALRWQCDLVLIPVLNCSGYNAHTRANGNGVDLNRDANSDTPQPETQIGISLPALFPEATAFIDHHNFMGPSWGDTIFWLGVKKLENLGICAEVCRGVGGYGRKEFDYQIQDNTALTRISQNTLGTFAQRWQDVSDVNGYLCETPRDPNPNGRLQDLRRFNIYVFKTFLHSILQRELQRRSNISTN